MRRSRRATTAGSAQCGDHSQRMSGAGCPGEKLTVTDSGTPLPTTLDGRVPPAVSMVPVTDTCALHDSPGIAGAVGTSKTMLPKAPCSCGVPRTTPQPAAPAGAVPTSRATETTVSDADETTKAAARRPNRPRTWVHTPDMAPSLTGSPLRPSEQFVSTTPQSLLGSEQPGAGRNPSYKPAHRRRAAGVP